MLFGDGAGRYADTARAWVRSLRVVRCLPTRAVPCSALLVRPGGYVAWASGGGGPLAGALAAFFGTGAGPGPVAASGPERVPA
ncbi:hypothetical protein [Streptomyces sp. NPDC014727]|uniref:aromatic-ring hydroxylase C-terminal domain-containing protein n=1 Tax=Streptomyces sp. NPDC014727 TaxID=3364883 RepID=UPI0036F81AFD